MSLVACSSSPPKTRKPFMSAYGPTKVSLIWSGFSMQTRDSGVAGRAYCTTRVDSDWTPAAGSLRLDSVQQVAINLVGLQKHRKHEWAFSPISTQFPGAGHCTVISTLSVLVRSQISCLVLSTALRSTIWTAIPICWRLM